MPLSSEPSLRAAAAVSSAARPGFPEQLAAPPPGPGYLTEGSGSGGGSVPGVFLPPPLTAPTLRRVATPLPPRPATAPRPRGGAWAEGGACAL